MIKILVFLGMALSIVKANGWIEIPNFCIMFCWVTSIVYALVYAFVSRIKEEIVLKMKERSEDDGRCPFCKRELRTGTTEEFENHKNVK